MSNEQVIQAIETIGIPHMNLEIDPSDILMKDEINSGKKLAIYLVQQFYNGIIESVENQEEPIPIDRSFQERALAYAKWYATKRATNLPDVIENATGWLFKDANETGWFNQLPGEFETLQEFLSTLYEDVPESSSTYSNWVFISQELLPLANTMDISANLILSASNNVKKVRGMVPAARLVMKKLNEGEIGIIEARYHLDDFLRQCANPDISYSEAKEKWDRYRGIVPKNTKVYGNIITTGPEQYMMIIEITDKKSLKMIQSATKHKVDWRFRDISYLLQRLFPQPVHEENPIDKIADRVKQILGGLGGKNN